MRKLHHLQPRGFDDEPVHLYRVRMPAKEVRKLNEYGTRPAKLTKPERAARRRQRRLHQACVFS